MKSVAASYDTDTGFGSRDDWKNDGTGASSFMFMATSATPLGNYTTSSINSKTFANVNFGSGNSRARNYQSKYRT